MRRERVNALEFPANPFVAFCDFLIVILIILILALIHETVSSSRLLERMAVAQLQNDLLPIGGGSHVSPGVWKLLSRAYQTGELKQTWVDGDLQRFAFRGIPFQSFDPMIRSVHGQKLLEAFGHVLALHQADPSNPTSRLLYKRIIVEGHSDCSEGSPDQVWSLSMQRAWQSAKILIGQSGIQPNLVEVSGRGCGVPADEPRNGGDGEEHDAEAAKNRRVEIVVVYSGRRALDYLEKTKSPELDLKSTRYRGQSRS